MGCIRARETRANGRRAVQKKRRLMTATSPGPHRRAFIKASIGGLAALTAGIARPGISRAADRPRISHGLQSGDVSADSAIVWTRADRPARVHIEAATTESFREVIRATVVDALPDTDLTAKVLLPDLPAG